MSPYLLVLVSVIYALVAVDQFFTGKPGMAIMWLGYVLANAGFIYHITTQG